MKTGALTLPHTGRHLGQNPLVSDGVQLIVREGSQPTQVGIGLDLAAYDGGPAAQHDDRQGLVIKPGLQHGGEQAFRVAPALFPNDLANILVQAARPAGQHLLDLGVGDGQAGLSRCNVIPMRLPSEIVED